MKENLIQLSSTNEFTYLSMEPISFLSINISTTICCPLAILFWGLCEYWFYFRVLNSQFLMINFCDKKSYVETLIQLCSKTYLRKWILLFPFTEKSLNDYSQITFVAFIAFHWYFVRLLLLLLCIGAISTPPLNFRFTNSHTYCNEDVQRGHLVIK